MEKQVKQPDTPILTKKFIKVDVLVKVASLGIAFLAIYMMSI